MKESAEAIVTSLEILSADRLSASARQAVVALCTRAFARDFASLFDYIAQAAEPMHVLAYRHSALIGHACWSTRGLQPAGQVLLHTAYVDAVATDPAYQGHGIGSLVVRRVMAETAHFALGALSTPRGSFYARLGWERWRGPAAVRTSSGLMPTPEDTVMILRTATTPPLDTTGLLVADWRAGDPW